MGEYTKILEKLDKHADSLARLEETVKNSASDVYEIKNEIKGEREGSLGVKQRLVRLEERQIILWGVLGAVTFETVALVGWAGMKIFEKFFSA